MVIIELYNIGKIVSYHDYKYSLENEFSYYCCCNAFFNSLHNKTTCDPQTYKKNRKYYSWLYKFLRKKNKNTIQNNIKKSEIRQRTHTRMHTKRIGTARTYLNQLKILRTGLIRLATAYKCLL